MDIQQLKTEIDRALTSFRMGINGIPNHLTQSEAEELINLAIHDYIQEQIIGEDEKSEFVGDIPDADRYDDDRNRLRRDQRQQLEKDFK